MVLTVMTYPHVIMCTAEFVNHIKMLSMHT